MDLSLVAQGIFQDCLCSASLTRPKANHDRAEINHIAIAKSAGTLPPRKLQLDNSVCLLEPGLNRLWLIKPRVGHNRPTNLSALQQPLHSPFVYPARTSQEPGPALIHERRKMLLKQSARRVAIHIARSKDRNRCSAGHDKRGLIWLAQSLQSVDVPRDSQRRLVYSPRGIGSEDGSIKHWKLSRSGVGETSGDFPDRSESKLKE
jgi:hypothetical protein